MNGFIAIARKVSIACVCCVLLAASTCPADDAPTPGNTTFEIIQYNAPPGWQLVERPGPVKIYTAPGTNAAQQAFIVILLGQPQATLDLRSAFDATINQTTGQGRIIDRGEVTAAKTRQGFDALSQSVVSESPNGQRLFLRMTAANVNTRMVAFSFMASSPALFRQHQGAMDTLLGSVSFAVPGAMADAGEVAKIKSQIEALEAQKQELTRKLAEIDEQQKRLAASLPGNQQANPGAANAAAANPGDDAQFLAKAREKFNADLASRRKPHTILGDILLLNGKPIPNVTTCTLYVKGTTIAAERTHYEIEADANGHFEQKIPDGIYNIQVTCIVNLDGHRVPVDLIPVDGKKDQIDQSSEEGIVRDYRVMISGLKPGADPRGAVSYFGGIINLTDPTFGDLEKRHPNGKVRMTFTPTGSLIDGTRRPPFVIEAMARDANFGAYLRGIPLCTYRVSAVIVTPDGRAQPLGCSRSFEGPFAAAAEMFWDPIDGSPAQLQELKLYVRE